jgi:hypothetical protein
MKYAAPEAFRAALDQRIRNEAVASGVPVMRLRKRTTVPGQTRRIHGTASDAGRQS